MFHFPTKETPVLFQGITSEMGLLQLKQALNYGTKVVAGISTQTGHKKLMGVPLFTHVSQAVKKYHPQISVIFSTPAHALNDVEMAAKSKIPLIICTTEHVPMHDAIKMRLIAEKNGVILLGPSSNGILSVDESLVGTIPTHLFKKGNVAVIGRSSSLIFESIEQIRLRGLGISKCITLGTDHLIATDYIPMIQALLDDKATKNILIIGQVHGHLEQNLAHFLMKKKTKKKIFVYIPGRTLIRSDKNPLIGMQSVLFSDILTEKRKIFEQAHVKWIDSVDKIGIIMKKGTK